jgi:hypothetical protein
MAGTGKKEIPSADIDSSSTNAVLVGVVTTGVFVAAGLGEGTGVAGDGVAVSISVGLGIGIGDGGLVGSGRSVLEIGARRSGGVLVGSTGPS